MSKTLKAIKQLEPKVKGYLVQNTAGDYLSRDLFWFPHKNPCDAYLFTFKQLKAMDWSGWETKPHNLIVASYSKSKGIEVASNFTATAAFDMAELGLMTEKEMEKALRLLVAR